MNRSKLLPLKEKLQKTDWLIDQIVYKLYGLTGEEIKIVEEHKEEQIRDCFANARNDHVVTLLSKFGGRVTEFKRILVYVPKIIVPPFSN